MGWSLVAHTGNDGLGSPVTTPGINTSGVDFIVISISQYSGFPVATLSDSKSNTWTPLTAASGTIAYSQIYYCSAPSVGSGHTFTIDTGGNVAGAIIVQAWSGSGASPFDQQSSAVSGAAATTVSAGSITPTANGELIVAAFCASDGTAGPSTINLSFSINAEAYDWTAGVTEGNYLATLVQTTAAAINPTWTIGSGTGELAATIASFKVAASGGNSISVPLATMSLDAKTPTVTKTNNNAISVPLATMTLAAQAPTVSKTSNNSIAVPLATISLNAFAPSIQIGGNQTINVPLATISLNALTPTVVAQDAKNIAVPLATMSMDAKTPTISVTANQTIAVPVASISLAAQIPTVLSTNNQIVPVPVAALTLNAFAPTVDAGGPQSINVPLAVMSLTVYAPTIVVTGQADQNSGGFGWWPDYEHVQRARRKRQQEIENAEAETSQLQDATDREIAKLLREQEAKDAERADLARLQKLADAYASKPPAELSKPVQIALWNAQDARTRNSLEQLRRMIEQEMQSEELAIAQIVLLMLTD